MEAGGVGAIGSDMVVPGAVDGSRVDGSSVPASESAGAEVTGESP